MARPCALLPSPMLGMSVESFPNGVILGNNHQEKGKKDYSKKEHLVKFHEIPLQLLMFCRFPQGCVLAASGALSSASHPPGPTVNKPPGGRGAARGAVGLPAVFAALVQASSAEDDATSDERWGKQLSRYFLDRLLAPTPEPCQR